MGEVITVKDYYSKLNRASEEEKNKLIRELIIDSDMKPTIDDVAAYWENRPCNIRHSPLPVGTREYFDACEKRKRAIEPHITPFAEYDKWKGKRVLEIGVGLGVDAINFARAGADYHGVELSEVSLALAKKRFELYELKGTLYLGNAEHLTDVVPVQPFDLVYSFGVIHHTPNPEAVVQSVKSYMNAESEFRLMLYAKNSWKRIMIEAGLDQPEAQSGCPVANTYTHDDVRELLSDYDVFSIEQAHIFPYIVEKYKQYEYEWQPWFEAMPTTIFRALEKNLGWHTLIKAKLKQ